MLQMLCKCYGNNWVLYPTPMVIYSMGIEGGRIWESEFGNTFEIFFLVQEYTFLASPDLLTGLLVQFKTRERNHILCWSSLACVLQQKVGSINSLILMRRAGIKMKEIRLSGYQNVDMWCPCNFLLIKNN